MNVKEARARLIRAEQANDTVRRLEQEINQYLDWAVNPDVSRKAISMLEQTLKTIKEESESSVLHEHSHISRFALQTPVNSLSEVAS